MELIATLIWLVPLFGFALNGIFGKYWGKSMSGMVGVSAVAAAFVATCLLYFYDPGPFTVHYADWIKLGSVSLPFELYIDHLTLVMLLVINGVGALIHLYSVGYMHKDPGFRKFFVYLNLFVFSMNVLVMGGNLLVIFIGWEGVGLCSFLLIGFWHQNRAFNQAARKAFVMNRIGDLGFLIACFLILHVIGSLDVQEIIAQKDLLLNSGLLTFICLGLFVAATGKSAQIPLFTWLPDAMAGPTPVSALIHAATMVTAGIYLIARLNGIFLLTPEIMQLILVVAILTALVAGFIALKQNDIKKVLAYSTVSQLGFMFAALGVGAFTAAIFHLVTHAFFKALLFLGAGSVIHGLHEEQDIRFMGGLKDKMKTTHWTFLCATMAISGIPLLSGYFSKDEILISLYSSQKWAFILMVIAAVVTAIYMFRLYFLVFWGKYRGGEESEKKIHESPSTMTVPLIILAILSLVGGVIGLSHLFYSEHFLANFLQGVLPASAAHVSHQFEIILLLATLVVLAVIIFMLYKKYVSTGHVPAAQAGGIWKLFQRKFYVDEIYHTLFVKPLLWKSEFGHDVFDRNVVDGAVRSVGKLARSSGNALRSFHNGIIGSYVMAMVACLIIALFVLFIFNYSPI